MADRDDGDRKLTLRTTPLIRWRIETVRNGHVYHAVETRFAAGGEPYAAPACGMTGYRTVLEDDKSEHCLECRWILAQPEP